MGLVGMEGFTLLGGASTLPRVFRSPCSLICLPQPSLSSSMQLPFLVLPDEVLGKVVFFPSFFIFFPSSFFWIVVFNHFSA